MTFLRGLKLIQFSKQIIFAIYKQDQVHIINFYKTLQNIFIYKLIMSQEIEENINKILKNQNSKHHIQNKLKSTYFEQITDRIQIDCMMFQVVKDNIVTDHNFFFPCFFLVTDDQKVQKQQRKSKDVPKIGSFIRTIKMDFDVKTYSLLIYDYQYLGGQGSIPPSNGARVNWNTEYITQLLKKNSTTKRGQVILNSYTINKTITQPFEYPQVQFVTVKLMQKILEDSVRQMNGKIQKILIPRDDELQIKDIEINQQKADEQEF